MFEDLKDLIPIGDVARRLPPPLRGTHVSTVFRWCLRGVGTPPVKLATVRVGGRRFVTPDALDRFVAELSAAPGRGPARPRPSDARAAQRRRAEDQLDAANI